MPRSAPLAVMLDMLIGCDTGRARWSLRLLEKHVALLDDIPDLDHSTIGRVLKKRNFALI